MTRDPNQKNLKLSFKLHDLTNTGFFAGYASVFNMVDLQNDKVAPGAFAVSLRRWQQTGEMPKMLWQHDPRYPIGAWQTLQEDSHGLYVEGQLLLDIRKGQEAYKLLQARAIEGMSIGYRVVEGLRDRRTQIRTLTCLDLLEISLVTFAANSKAKVTRVKNLEDLPAPSVEVNTGLLQSLQSTTYTLSAPL